MAICTHCRREMMKADTCNETPIIIGALVFNPIKYGEGSESTLIDESTHPRCHDCNVRWGNYHHPSCDMEECPKCHGQLISCGCIAD